ncbi:hypothetical protein [Brevibacterium litoralis]|uniref:hypothetical protein n=1 Tax=Brevibacterium litoralis TaxID=3138935 RepID=UPI0032EF58DB
MTRLVLAVVSALVGVLLLVPVVSALSVVGPDDVTETPVLTLDDGVSAFVLNQGVVPYENTTAALHVRAPEGTQVFLGQANGVDVRSYLAGVSTDEVTTVTFPGSLEHRSRDGAESPGASPDSRDWWTEQQVGTEVSHTFDLEADPQMLVVLPAAAAAEDGTAEDGAEDSEAAEAPATLDGTQVSMSMRTDGVFGLAVLGIGLVVLFLGLGAFFFLLWWNGRIRPRKRRVGTVTSGAGPTDSATSGSDRGAVRPRLLVPAAAVVLALVLAGCAPLDFARPSQPVLEEPRRPAVLPGGGAAFMENYTQVLEEALDSGGDGIDRTMYGPMLDRTRAEQVIAEAGGSELSAVHFARVTAAGPTFTEYPLWFLAFAEPTEDSENVQVLLATRESASEEWMVPQGLFVPRSQMPTLVTDESGGVPAAPEAHGQVADQISSQLAGYLETGNLTEIDGVATEFPTEAFSDFRSYVDEFAASEDFESVGVECGEDTTVDLGAHALTTESGSVSVGEMRCTITFSVASSYSLDLGEQIEAVMTTDSDGNTVSIHSSLPYYVNLTGTEGDDPSAFVSAPDWFLLSAETATG